MCSAAVACGAKRSGDEDGRIEWLESTRADDDPLDFAEGSEQQRRHARGTTILQLGDGESESSAQARAARIP